MSIESLESPIPTVIESHALMFFPVFEHDEVRTLRALLGPTAAVFLVGFKRFVFDLQVAVAADLHALLAGQTIIQVWSPTHVLRR